MLLNLFLAHQIIFWMASIHWQGQFVCVQKSQLHLSVSIIYDIKERGHAGISYPRLLV